ncbi:hypothetical protein [Arthrobacter crystallopoietes]|uniref:Uncharacterized protein n=1 Tax=Crystallibacter crystallopoietes TaxID=37928 RepID=A0A1H0ZUI4_9MICC|nr:hypothetical protein [Arthrobacter crystallopoietes]AUI51810.1 hypothetical protein AC20117_14455 [Arthrobacter crystallopoietes]SDQ31029.1 hypothetical protein SAMN04489742_0570 [Arthrobacter crystallopoietes]
MEFAIIMIVLVVAAVVWLLMSTRADRVAARRVRAERRADAGWVGPGAYGAGTIGGLGFYDSGSSSCDSGGGGGGE